MYTSIHLEIVKKSRERERERESDREREMYKIT